MRAAELLVHDGIAKYEAGENAGAEANMAKMLAAEASWAAGMTRRYDSYPASLRWAGRAGTAPPWSSMRTTISSRSRPECAYRHNLARSHTL